MICGVGVDIVAVERFRAIIERKGDRFLGRVFSEAEIRYARTCAHPEQRFATRFAAKEAVLKALGIGWRRGVSFREIEVSTNEAGAPAVSLSGRALEVSRALGVERMHVSLSHDSTYAVAQVVAEGEHG
jgi:holo-[acyl-carrier protein] synthase